LRVLIVEDDADCARNTAMLLGLFGHWATVAGDGASALDAARDIRPDVVLLDLGLPGMDGWEVAGRMGPAGGKRPLVIAVTGFGMPDDHRRSSEAGIDLHLVKPVDPDCLLAILKRFREFIHD
jgi:DNA-binding response OmpR family regulator